MKNIILILFTIFISSQLYSQEENALPELIYFNYDNAGNQVKRYKENEPIIMSEKNLKSNSQLLSAYPNPTNSDVTLEWLPVDERKILKIEVFSIQGRLLQEFEVLKSQINQNISLRGYSSGIYFINASYSDKSSTTKKIIKL